MALGPLDSDRQAEIAKIAELKALLDEGLEDVKSGRVYTPDQVREHMKAYAAGIKLTDESA